MYDGLLVANGHLCHQKIPSISQVTILSGEIGRPDAEAITVFKSVGLGVEDLIVAGVAVR